MTFRDTAESWGLVQRILHWGMAGLILFQLAVGFWMVEFADVYQRFVLTQMHKSWGAAILSLAVVRILWRAVNTRPAMPEEGSRLRRLSASVMHRSLYTLMVLLPLSGWLMASASPLQDAYGLKNMVFGLVELPDPFVPGSARL